MSTAVKQVDTASAMAVLDSTITYPVAMDAIEKLEAMYMPLVVDGVDDKTGLSQVKAARQDVKTKRVAVEKRRKELKAGALDYGRKVDSAAKQLTEKLRPIEDHLQLEEKKVSDEKARIKLEAEEKRRQKTVDRITKLEAVDCRIPTLQIEVMSDEEFAAALKDATEAHARRMAEEAEQKRQHEEERKRQAEEAERLKVEREKIQEEVLKVEQARLQLEAAKRRVEQQQLEMQRQRELEKAKAEDAERASKEEAERIEREVKEKQRREREAEAEARRQEALRPDREKLLEVAIRVGGIAVPSVSSDLSMVVNLIQASLDRCVADILEAVNDTTSTDD